MSRVGEPACDDIKHADSGRLGLKRPFLRALDKHPSCSQSSGDCAMTEHRLHLHRHRVQSKLCYPVQAFIIIRPVIHHPLHGMNNPMKGSVYSCHGDVRCQPRLECANDECDEFLSTASWRLPWCPCRCPLVSRTTC